MNKYYILDERGQPVLAKDVFEWARWFETADRVVASSVLPMLKLRVSTVFIGIDSKLSGPNRPPVVWETLVFDEEGNEHDGDQCAGNFEQAEAMHLSMVNKFLARVLITRKASDETHEK
jgi:hypothetical protein